MTIRQAQRRRVRAAFCAVIGLSALSISGCASIKSAPGINQLFGDDNPDLAADPTAQAGIDYSIAVQGLGVGETPEETAENLRMLEIVKSQARIYKLQEKPPPSVALLKRRAAADVDLVERALKSEGYYEGSATITVNSTPKAVAGTEEAAEADLQEALAAENQPILADIADPDSPPVVNIYVRKGPRYSLARQGVVIDPEVAPDVAERVREAASKSVGGPAQGAAVVDAEQAALGELNREGRPYAKKGKRRAEANFDLDTLDIVTQLNPGPYTVYGDTTIVGEREVERAYIADFITWKRGSPISRGVLRDAQRALAGTQLFDSVTVEIPSDAPEDFPVGEIYYAPVVIKVEEAKHRTIGGGLSFSTADGPGITAKWEHRNLRGQNERLTGTLDIDMERQSAEVEFVKPRYGKPTRDLVADFEVFHEENDAFDVTGAEGFVGIREELSDNLKGTIGLGFEAAQTKEDGNTRESYLVGVPMTLAYDDTDSLLDPTEGVRAGVGVAPWGGLFDKRAAGFVVVDLNGSTYIPFDRKHNYVFALRGRAATIFAESRDDVPATRRLFAGGGGSVRGFEERYVGPLDDQGDPLGGLSAFEINAEMRLRFGSFGVVPFVDAGTVGEELFSEFDTIRYAVGLGLRYYSPVGPIRLDVAVPFKTRERDNAFEFYLSIGQAF